jgi:hypothetical protein
MFTENGPFTLNDASMKQLDEDGVPRVFDNPHGWHQAANMLYVEHPAPTGFSYCEDAQGGCANRVVVVFAAHARCLGHGCIPVLPCVLRIWPTRSCLRVAFVY